MGAPPRVTSAAAISDRGRGPVRMEHQTMTSRGGQPTVVNVARWCIGVAMTDAFYVCGALSVVGVEIVNATA